jgi:hypothetical protein
VGEYERASADVERFPEKYGMEPSLPSPPELYPVETQGDLEDNGLHPARHAAAATARGGRSSS